MTPVTYIDIGAQFSMTPGPRYISDGPFSGELFRREFLEKAFRESDLVVVKLDKPDGYGASFLEEAFGGLVRVFGLAEVDQKLRFDAIKRAYLLPRIRSEMEKAERSRKA